MQVLTLAVHIPCLRTMSVLSWHSPNCSYKKKNPVKQISVCLCLLPNCTNPQWLKISKKEQLRSKSDSLKSYQTGFLTCTHSQSSCSVVHYFTNYIPTGFICTSHLFTSLCGRLISWTPLFSKPPYHPLCQLPPVASLQSTANPLLLRRKKFHQWQVYCCSQKVLVVQNDEGLLHAGAQFLIVSSQF